MRLFVSSTSLPQSSIWYLVNSCKVSIINWLSLNQSSFTHPDLSRRTGSEITMIAPSTTPSSPGGSLNDGGFDSKIASLRVRLREEHVARLKEAMAGSIQEECKRHDDAIKSAWEAIEKAMETFKAHKHNLFEAMREDEGHARTQQAIESGGLDQITPTSYQMIVDRLALSDHKVKVLAHSRQPSPAVKERLPSPTLTPTSATAPPAKQFTVRTDNQTEHVLLLTHRHRLNGLVHKSPFRKTLQLSLHRPKELEPTRTASRQPRLPV